MGVAGTVRAMKWAIVGGGVLGTALALELRHAQHEVTIFEAADDLGGLAAPWTLADDIVWDRHYHVTLLSDRRTNALYDALGLSSEMQWAETRTGYYGLDRVLRSVTSPLEFLRLPDLTIVSKVRLALTILYGSMIRDGRRMERISVERWLRRWSGDRAFDTFWHPLLRAKLGDEYTAASAAFIWSTIRRLSAARRAGLEAERFGTVNGGYRRVFDAASERCRALGIDVRLATPVTSVRRTTDSSLIDRPTNDQIMVETASGAESFDRVVVTTAAPLAARLCGDLLDGERRRLDSVRYVGIVCASVVLRRPLAGYYLTYITDPTTPFTAVVEMTALIDRNEVAGRTLVYLPKYTNQEDPLFEATDDEVRAEFLPFLRTMYPAIGDDDIETFRVSRVRQVFAVPTIGYSAAMPTVATSVPGLYLAGSANLAFATLNVDDTLSLVEAVLAADAMHPHAPVRTVSCEERRV